MVREEVSQGMTVAAFTGHRPNKLGGYGPFVFQRLVKVAERALIDVGVSKAIVGMALGWDQAVAQACVNRGVPFIAAVPFVGQESLWPADSRQTYSQLIAAAESVEICSPGGYSKRAMHVRNEWMVDHADLLIALHDGTQGGTGACINYAHSRNVEVVNMWPFWQN